MSIPTKVEKIVGQMDPYGDRLIRICSKDVRMETKHEDGIGWIMEYDSANNLVAQYQIRDLSQIHYFKED